MRYLYEEKQFLKLALIDFYFIHARLLYEGSTLFPHSTYKIRFFQTLQSYSKKYTFCFDLCNIFHLIVNANIMKKNNNKHFFIT